MVSHPMLRFIVPVLLGLLLASPAAGRAADAVHVVQRGETLSGIARRQGVSVARLADYNNLAHSHRVTAGQHLRLPPRSAPPPSAASPLPPGLRDGLAKAPVKPGRWQYIVIHHSGVDEGTVKAMDRYHRQVRGMEHGLAYHFVIGNGNGMGDGEIAIGPRWRDQLDGGHLRSESQNKIALGICLVGNFDKRGPTAAQLKSLNLLTRALLERCQLPPGAVKTHQQINVVGTRCPGTKFPARSFLLGLRE